MCVMDLETMSGLLDLEGFEVVEAALQAGPDKGPGAGRKFYRLVVVPTEVVGLCPHCGVATGDRHACYDWEIIDLPLGGFGTHLVVRGWQFRCGPCRKFFTPRRPALAPGAHATRRFVERLAELAGRSDVSAAASFLGVAEKTAEKWYYDHLKRRQAEPAAGKGLEPVKSLGIDELSLKKGTASSSAC
jgi:transposase